jgi:hypothetical protein
MAIWPRELTDNPNRLLYKIPLKLSGISQKKFFGGSKKHPKVPQPLPPFGRIYLIGKHNHTIVLQNYSIAGTTCPLTNSAQFHRTLQQLVIQNAPEELIFR